MTSSRPDEEGPEQEDLVEGSAGTDIPKMAGGAAARPEPEVILELILAGDKESLLRAFQTNPWTASDLIAALVKSGQPAWAEYAPTLESMLSSVLTSTLPSMGALPLEGQVKPEVLEQQAFVRIHLVKALASVAQEPWKKSRAIDLVLSEVVNLRREAWCGPRGHHVVLRADGAGAESPCVSAKGQRSWSRRIGRSFEHHRIYDRSWVCSLCRQAY